MSRRVTILDDYQNVALTSADWSVLGDEVELDVTTSHIADAQELVERLADSEVIVAMRERTAFPAETLTRLDRLRLLVTTGPANAVIDVDAAAAKGITVSGTRHTGNAVAEQTMGMMIAVSRGFVTEDRNIREGRWQSTIGPGLQGRTLGLVGLGRLGGRVARLAQAFEMRVIAWSPHLTQARADAFSVEAVSREHLFASSDFISVHMVLARATRGLIGEADLARMKPSAYLINTSRGPLIDEDALYASVVGGTIAGVALDVFDIEPLPADHRLRALPNSLLLPHTGYVAEEAYRTFYSDAVEDIRAYYSGTPIRVLPQRSTQTGRQNSSTPPSTGSETPVT